MSNVIGKSAVVLGGSVAGLLAARVLSEKYGNVTVVDRDVLSHVTGPRRAVPQGHHIHALLARGQQIIDELFPGFTAELADNGVPLGDFGADLRWYFNGRLLRQPETGLICVSAGRTVLENFLRDRVRAIKNVNILDETDIVALTATSDARRVTGVRLAPSRGGSESVIEADLVVDATGRGSRTPRWLTELGYDKVPEERVKMGLTYVSRNYRMPMPTDPFGSAVGIIPVATPENPRGAIFARFADRYALSLTGILGDVPPTDPDGFLEYTKSLPIPDIFETVRDAEPLDDPVAFHFPASVRRRYEDLARVPDGLLVTGDAACIFNPVYGQGMTVAAMETLVLRDHLAAGEPNPAAFFADQAATIENPWAMSAGADLSFPGVEGRRTLKVQMANGLVPRYQSAAAEDEVLAEAFLRAAGLVDTPDDLTRPDLMMRLMKHRPSPARRFPVTR